MKRVLFIDRDGTLIEEPADEQVDSLEKLVFMPGVLTALNRIARTGIYELVIVTNQDGLGTSRFPEEAFWPAHEKMLATFRGEGVTFDAVCIDRSFPEDNAPTRKPGTGLLTPYLDGRYDLNQSFVIGDRITDLHLAKNIGAKGVLIGAASTQAALARCGLSETCDLLATTWEQIAAHVLKRFRAAAVQRTTRETDIRLMLRLDAGGPSVIHTGLHFFDHMLDQLARHGNLAITLNVKGDLQVDEHHTVEDTALALGEAFRQALADKRGLSRYGFCLPMDDCLAQVAIDFGGRPCLVWKAEFRREKIGDMPTELFHHFFKSFSDAAVCNLNIQAEGINEHHKIESIFKAFARAIRLAVALDDTGTIPSTKGLL